MNAEQWATIANSAAIIVHVWWTVRHERAEARAVPHTAGVCGGLPGRCPACIDLYHQVLGRDVVPLCAACGTEHWPYDPHRWNLPQGWGVDREK